jgi:hypothetical protein
MLDGFAAHTHGLRVLIEPRLRPCADHFRSIPNSRHVAELRQVTGCAKALSKLDICKTSGGLWG